MFGLLGNLLSSCRGARPNYVRSAVARPKVRCVALAAIALTAATANAQLYRDLHDFGGMINTGSGQDGTNPDAGVVFDTHGNMFGTSGGFGATSGNVWEITSSGVYKDLHDFGGTVINADGTSGPDGNGPNAVSLDINGNLYGTTSAGGPFWGGASYTGGNVWEITSSGEYRDLHDFGTANDGSGALAGVTVSPTGNLYGTTAFGGADGYGMVWEISSSGSFVDLHDFGGLFTNDGYQPLSNVVVDSAGNMYGTAAGGGYNSEYGMVWEIAKDGTYKDLHDFGRNVKNANGSTGSDGTYPSGSIALDLAGNLYGTATYGGPSDYSSPGNPGDGMVWEITTQGAYLDLHDFGKFVTSAAGATVRDGANPFGGVAFDPMGNLYGTTGGAGPNGTTIAHVPLQEVAGNGNVWEITAAGAYFDLHDFGGNLVNSSGKGFPDGSVPFGGATPGLVGRLYGTTQNGGSTMVDGALANAGMIWKIGPGLQSLSAKPSTLVGGVTLSCTVTLSAPAPAAGGASVLIYTSAKAVVAPSSVAIPAGQVSTSFLVTTPIVASTTKASVTALYGTATSVVFTLNQPQITSLSLNPATVAGSGQSTGSVALAAEAPSGGVVVTLSSSSKSAAVPSAVRVAAGATTATFTVKTVPVGSTVGAKITAQSGPSTQTVTLTISAPVLTSLAVKPAAVIGGSPSVGTVTIGSVAPSGGLPVALSSNSTSVSVPTSVTIPAGKSSANFDIGTEAVSASLTATITAKNASVSQTAKLAVIPPVISSISLNPTSVNGGVSSTATVTLTGPAPSGGFPISLSSSSNSAKAPSSVSVPANKNTVTFTVTTSKVTAQTTSTISAKNGANVKTALLTITP